jgi:DeoR family transcriptional regulator of aga operon
MMLSSKRRILIADGSKLGQTHLGVVAAVREFDLLITGPDAQADALAAIGECGIEVLQAPVGPQ